MRARDLLASVQAVARDFSRHDCFDLAASLSYYTLLSFAPLIIVVVALASLVFDRAGVENRIIIEMSALVGDAGTEVLKTVLENASARSRGTALWIGIITLVIGASSVFVQLQDALNRIFDVSETRASTIKTAMLSRVLSIAMLISVGFLLLVTLVVSAGVAALQSWMHPRVEVPTWVWSGVDVVVSLMIVTLLMALIYKLLPAKRLAWSDVRYGAFITAVLFTIGKKVIGEYLGRASVGSAYGAAGSIVVLLAWTYYAALIFFLGAILTRRHADRRSKRGVSSPAEVHPTGVRVGA